MLDVSLGFDLLVAALAGLAVGLEREWSGHSAGPDARFAGLRTFAMLGAIGGFSGWFLKLEMPAAAACLLIGAVLFIVVAYATTMQRPGSTTDGTTEIAAILVLAIGVASGSGRRTIASAAAALLVVLLAEKSTFQRTLQRIGAGELRATLQFAVMALVILPLLPDRAMGPYDAFQPRELWTVVLLFSALNFAGYIARRLIGETRGLAVTGLLGGLVSSTAVTLGFSRRSRSEPAVSLSLALGVVAACTILPLRVLVIASSLEPTLLAPLTPLLVPVFAAGAATIAFVLWRERDTRPLAVAAHETNTDIATSLPRTSPVAGELANPLALGTSIQMAVGFQLVLFIIAWVHTSVGDTGVLASAALLGLTDMDALTLSMSRIAADAAQTHVAALAIGIGVVANTVLKLALIVFLGSPRFRSHAAAALVLLGTVGAIALGWRW